MILSRKTLLFPLLLLGLLVLFASCEDLLNAATGDEETAPDDPGNFVAVLASGNVIEMSWTDGSDNENGFIIEANTSGSIVWNQIADVGRNITSYAWHDAAENTTYTFRIYAYNDVDNSGYAQSQQVIVSLGAPTDLTATWEDTRVVLQWNDNSQVEEGFRVQRNHTGSWEDLAELEVNNNSYDDTSPPAGVTVYYRVVAFGDGNVSAPSNEASINVPDFLSAPSNLSATVNGDVIVLNWTDNTNIETGFLIERAGGGASYFEIGRVDANITTYTDTDFPADADLLYRVFAYDNSDMSNPSNEASVHSPTPSTTVVFSDDFESYPPETVPGSPWTVSTSDETWVYAFVDTATVEDNLALWFADDADAEYGYVDLDLPSVAEGVFELDMGVVHSYTVDGFGLMLGFTDQITSSEEIGAYIEFIANDTNVQLYVHDGSDWVSYNFPPDEWFHFAIAWNTSNNGYRIFLNGTQLGGTYPFYNGNSGSVISTMSVVLFNNLTLYWGLLDNVVMTDGIPNDFTASPVAAIGPVVSQSKVTARSLRLNSDVVAPSRSRNAESLSAR